MKIIFETLLLSALLLCGGIACNSNNEKDNDDDNHTVCPPAKNYMWANESSHTITIELLAVEMDNEYAKYVMAPHETVMYLPEYVYMGKIESYDLENILFDMRYLVKISDLPNDMNIFCPEVYKYNPNYQDYNTAFIFTDAHYDYAVEHGTDLGE